VVPPVTLDLPPETLAAIETSLKELIGPMARHVMRSTASHVHSVDEFLSTLADKIPDLAEREGFRARIGRLNKHGGVPGQGLATLPGEKSQPRPPFAFDAQILARAEKQLAHHVGPLAKVLIKRAANDSGNVSELYRKLAEHIDSEPLRKVFLDSLR
jgi:serine/threonine-protein kinase